MLESRCCVWVRILSQVVDVRCERASPLEQESRAASDPCDHDLKSLIPLGRIVYRYGP